MSTTRSRAAAYDPWAPDVLADPYPFYEELRAGGGCHELPDLDMWVLSTYELVSAALRDHETFSSVGGVSREASDAAERRWIGEDPPAHTATRAFAAPVFRRSAIDRHAPAIRTGAGAVIERFVDAGGGEVVAELAEPVAVHALCEILGVPNEIPGEMAALSEATFVSISARSAADQPDGLDRLGLDVGIPLSRIIEAQLDREVEDPTSSVLDMITAHAGEDAGFAHLDQYGRALYLAVLVSPGVETTRTMIANAVELAARHPGAWDAVRSGELAASAFASEVLRFESPIQGFFRATTRAVEMGRTTIPAGARVLCLYASANRDESVFDDAATFRPGRSNAGRHVAYGVGIHRCIGAALAELEGVAALEALAARAARFDVTDAVRRTDMAQLRTFQRLDVAVTPGDAGVT